MKSPAYQWYPKDIMGSERVKLLSLIQEGAYRIALDSCWLHGSIPSDPKLLAKVIGKGCTPKLASEITHMFTKHPEDKSRLIHDRLEVERDKQIRNSERQRENGLKGGRPKSNPTESQTKPTGLPTIKPKKALHIAVAIATPVKLKRANALGNSDELPKATKTEYDSMINSLKAQGSEEIKYWNEIKVFISAYSPQFIEPYLDAWNILAGKYHLSKVQGASSGREKKFKTRMNEDAFNFIKILHNISKSDFLKGKNDGSWKVNFDWIIENDTNYLKILEEKFA